MIANLKLSKLPNEFVATFGMYGIIGILLNVLGLSVFYFLSEFGLAANLSLLSASMSILPLAYFLNRRYVFGAENSAKSRFRFIIVYLFVLFVNYIALDLALQATNIAPIYAQAAILFSLVVANYSVQSLWVFRARKKKKYIYG